MAIVPGAVPQAMLSLPFRLKTKTQALNTQRLIPRRAKYNGPH